MKNSVTMTSTMTIVYFFKKATVCAGMAGNSGLIDHNQQSVIIAVSGEQSQGLVLRLQIQLFRQLKKQEKS